MWSAAAFNAMLNWLLPLYFTLAGLVFGYDEAELLFVGDAMQHVAQRDAAKTRTGEYDFSQCFEALAPAVSSADFAVANLETPVGCPPYAGYPCFSAPASYSQALKDAGFDMCLTANNHTLDRGAKGLRATIATLDSQQMLHLGTYSNDSARRAAIPFVHDVNGIRIAFLNYTYGTNGISPRDGVVVDYIDRDIIAADVEASRRADADLIVVCIHWGDEYRLLPNTAQRHTADFLEALGVDIIIGGHPHVIEPMELRPNRYYPEKQVFLVYSLGNFISNMKTPDTRGGAMARVRLCRRPGEPVEIVGADYRLVFTEPGSSPANNFRVVPLEDAKIPQAREFERRARGIFDEHNINVPESNGLTSDFGGSDVDYKGKGIGRIKNAVPNSIFQVSQQRNSLGH